LPEVLERWKESISSGVRFDMVFPLRGADGILRPFLTRANPVINASGQLIQWFGTNTDITDQVRMEAELRENDQRKDEFLAMLAHELRNPLGAISSVIQLAQATRNPELLAQFSETIQRQVIHLTRLIDDLLDVSRITQGKIDLKKTTVDLRTVINHAVELVHPIISAKNHQLTIAVPNSSVRFVADATRTEQILGNLLTNAAKYSDPGGKIHLSAEVDDLEIVFVVRDNGVGIEDAMLPQVFGLFTQVDASADRSQGGLGIGLTLVKNLVEMHGGTVTASSGGKDKGSEFTVRLPLGRPEESQFLSFSHEIKALTGTGRVLVVDDNLDTARLTSRLLKQAGFEVEVAHGGPEAIEVAHWFTPSVVLLDIGLPGMNGYEVATHLRDDPASNAALMIAVSGYAEEKARERSRATGFDHYLTKPLDFGQLMALIAPPSESIHP
jgi:signal transduction histidine kinase/ActR/RegA family two-component response regulator